MARQIAETPILFGEDAARFLRDMENIQPASKEEKAFSSDAYKWMKSIATFQM